MRSLYGLPYPISSKGSFVCSTPQTTAFVTPVVEQWLELEIVQWVHLEGLIRRDTTYTKQKHQTNHNQTKTMLFVGVCVLFGFRSTRQPSIRRDLTTLRSVSHPPAKSHLAQSCRRFENTSHRSDACSYELHYQHQPNVLSVQLDGSSTRIPQTYFQFRPYMVIRGFSYLNCCLFVSYLFVCFPK